MTPSASCAAAVRDAYPRIAGRPRPGLARAAEGLAVYELTEFLVDVLGVTDVGAYFPHRVTYHPACASLARSASATGRCGCCARSRAWSWSDLPARGRVLRVRRRVRDEERRHVGRDGRRQDHATSARPGADVVCATDNSCLAHIGGALSRLRSGVRAVHLAEILAATGPA